MSRILSVAVPIQQDCLDSFGLYSWTSILPVADIYAPEQSPHLSMLTICGWLASACPYRDKQLANRKYQPLP